MENAAKKHKFEAQDAFWKSIIEKYEARNQELEREQIDLQGRIDQMDASMPAIMAFNMAKLAQGQPDADVGSLVKIPCTCMVDCAPKESLKIPDMTNVSVFSIEDQDVHYMDRIKELTDTEKKLIDEVNKLRSKEKSIKDTKKKVEKIMCDGKGKNKTSVDGNELQKMNEKLLDENRLLNYEIADLKLEMKHIRETIEGPLARELDRERRKALKLESELKNKMCTDNAKYSTAQREVDFLREQVQAADRNLKDMVEINNKLKCEMEIIERRMMELQNDLIHQKISEATCLALLKSQIGKPCADSGSGGPPCPPPPPPPSSVCKDLDKPDGPSPPPPREPCDGPCDEEDICGDQPPPAASRGPCDKEEKVIKPAGVCPCKKRSPFKTRGSNDGPEPRGPCGREDKSDNPVCPCNKRPPCNTQGSLYDIARDLSKELKAADHIPDDLRDTVNQIKSLCDLIDENICEAERVPKERQSKIVTLEVEELPEKLEPPEEMKPPEEKEPPKEMEPPEETEPPEEMEPTEEMEPPEEMEQPKEKELPEEKELSEEKEVPEEKDLPEEKEMPEESSEADEPEVVEHEEPQDEVEEAIKEVLVDVEEIVSKADDEPIEAPESETEAGVEEVEEEEQEAEELDHVPERESKEISEVEIPVRDDASVPCVSSEKSITCVCDATKVDSEYVEQIEAITELEPAAGEVQVRKTCNDGLNVTTTVTRSGILEVITEGPAGVIETTMTVTMSGNVEVVTEFTECGESRIECNKTGGKPWNIEDSCRECGFFRESHAGVDGSSDFCAVDIVIKCSSEEVTKCSSDEVTKCSSEEVTICSSEEVTKCSSEEVTICSSSTEIIEEIIIEEEIEEPEEISVGSSKYSAIVEEEPSFVAEIEELPPVQEAEIVEPEKPPSIKEVVVEEPQEVPIVVEPEIQTEELPEKIPSEIEIEEEPEKIDEEPERPPSIKEAEEESEKTLSIKESVVISEKTPSISEVVVELEKVPSIIEVEEEAISIEEVEEEAISIEEVEEEPIIEVEEVESVKVPSIIEVEEVEEISEKAPSIEEESEESIIEAEEVEEVIETDECKSVSEIDECVSETVTKEESAVIPCEIIAIEEEETIEVIEIDECKTLSEIDECASAVISEKIPIEEEEVVVVVEEEEEPAEELAKVLAEDEWEDEEEVVVGFDASEIPIEEVEKESVRELSTVIEEDEMEEILQEIEPEVEEEELPVTCAEEPEVCEEEVEITCEEITCEEIPETCAEITCAEELDITCTEITCAEEIPETCAEITCAEEPEITCAEITCAEEPEITCAEITCAEELEITCAEITCAEELEITCAEITCTEELPETCAEITCTEVTCGPVDMVDAAMRTNLVCDCTSVQTAAIPARTVSVQETNLDLESLKQRLSDSIAESNIKVLDAIEEAQSTLRESLEESQKRLSETLQSLSEKEPIRLEYVDEPEETQGEIFVAEEEEEIPLKDVISISTVISLEEELTQKERMSVILELDEEKEVDTAAVREESEPELWVECGGEAVVPVSSSDEEHVVSETPSVPEEEKVVSSKGSVSYSEHVSSEKVVPTTAKDSVSTKESEQYSEEKSTEESSEKVVATEVKDSSSVKVSDQYSEDKSAAEVSSATIDKVEEEEEEEWHDAEDSEVIQVSSGKGDFEKSVSSASVPTHKTQSSAGVLEEESKSTGVLESRQPSASRSEIEKSMSSTGTSKRSSRSAMGSRKDASGDTSIIDLPPCDCGPHPDDCMCIDCITKPSKEDQISLNMSDTVKICGCQGPCDCTCDLEIKTCQCKGICVCKTCPLKPKVPPETCPCSPVCKCAKCRYSKMKMEMILPDCDCKVCMCRDCLPLPQPEEEDLVCGCNKCDCEECQFLREQLGEFVCDCDLPCDCEECLFMAAREKAMAEARIDKTDTFKMQKSTGDFDEKEVKVHEISDTKEVEKTVKESSDVIKQAIEEKPQERKSVLTQTSGVCDCPKSVPKPKPSPVRTQTSGVCDCPKSIPKPSPVLTQTSVVCDCFKSVPKPSPVLTQTSRVCDCFKSVPKPSPVLTTQTSRVCDCDKSAQKPCPVVTQTSGVCDCWPSVEKPKQSKREVYTSSSQGIPCQDQTLTRGVCDCPKGVPCRNDCKTSNIKIRDLQNKPSPSVQKAEKEVCTSSQSVPSKDPRTRGICDCPKGVPCRNDCETDNIKIRDLENKSSQGIPSNKQYKYKDKSPLVESSAQETSEPSPEYGKNVEELYELMEQIKCACQEAEVVAKPPMVKQASDITETLSNLEVALEALQEKSETKDVLIDALKEELRLRAKGDDFEQLINDMFSGKENVEDYDRSTLSESLSKPPPSKNLLKFGRLPLACICTNDKRSESCECKVNPDPLEINDIRRIGPTSILLKWKPARSDQVMGYEICVNDVVKSRVFSPRRTSAIVDGLNLKGNVNISIYATCYSGRCKPPATAVYKM